MGRDCFYPDGSPCDTFTPPSGDMDEARKMANELSEMDKIPNFFIDENQWNTWFFQLKNRYDNKDRDLNKETFDAIRIAQTARNGRYGGKSRKLRRKVKRGGDNNSTAKCNELEKQLEVANLNVLQMCRDVTPSYEKDKNGHEITSDPVCNQAIKTRDIIETDVNNCSQTTSGGKARRTRRTNKVKKSGKKARKSSKKSRKAGKKARKTHRRRR